MKIIPLTKESKDEFLRTLAIRSTDSFTKQQAAVDEIVREVLEVTGFTDILTIE